MDKIGFPFQIMYSFVKTIKLPIRSTICLLTKCVFDREIRNGHALFIIEITKITESEFENIVNKLMLMKITHPHNVCLMH